MKLSRRARIVAIGVAAGLCAGFLLPSRAHLESAIVIRARPPVIFGKLEALARALKWDGPQGQDANWVEQRAENQLLRFGSSDQGVGGRFYRQYALQKAGDSTTVTVTFDGDLKDLGDRLGWVYLKGKVDRLDTSSLETLKRVSEAASIGPSLER
jgi:hypothetical protein